MKHLYPFYFYLKNISREPGYITFKDIESRWNAQEEGGAVPAGVLDSLR